MNAKQQQFKRFATLIEFLAKEFECPDRWPLLDCCANAMREAAQGHARYEALRLLNPQQFSELWSRALLGRNFDELVDELVKAKNESQ